MVPERKQGRNFAKVKEIHGVNSVWSTAER